MKKLFTFLTLLLCAVAGAWADTETTTAALKDWTSSLGTGAVLTWDSDNTVAVINCGTKDGEGVTLTSNQSFKNISKIDLTVYLSGRDKTSIKIEVGTITAGVFSATTTINSSYADSKLTLGSITCSKNKANTSGTVTISPTTSGYVRITMANSGGTGKTGKLSNVKITAEPKTLASAELTGININGTAWDMAGLSSYAATISDEYAGPPTVEYIYTATYDDATSETGKKHEIVATKNGTNYQTVSTIFTNNVTLNFTNVSNVLFSMTNPTAPTEELASKTSSNVTATFSPGGSATVYNGHGSSASQLVYNDQINLGGSGNSYFLANFTAAIAEGDIITSSNTTASTFKIGINSTAGNAKEVDFPYTVPSGSNLIGQKSVFVFKTGTSGTSATFNTFTITRPKTIDSQALGGVKEGETTLTETTDYTVSSNTITLTDAHKAIVAPTDIKLINRITYDDSSTDDKDVDVTLAKNGDFFEGTATIGATTYTVKVPVDTSTPLLSLSAATGTISLNSYTPTGTVKVTVTGANLANGTFNAPTADGVTVTPATVEITDGTLSQEFTITTTATTAASTDITFAYTGAESKTFTLAYSKTAKRSVAQTDVTSATTWDWKNAGSASIELKGEGVTDPQNGKEFILSDLPEITNDATFNSQALKVACQWPNRGENSYLQGNTIKFNVTVPGTVQVWFSNTSNRDDNAKNRRFLYVNGTNSDVYTLNQDFVNTEAIAVPAGEVVINAFTGEETPAATMVRVNKIIFTPTVTIGDAGYATYVAAEDVAVPEGVKAYFVTAADGGKATLEKVSDIPEGAAVILEGAKGTYALTATTATTDAASNLLKASTGLTADGTQYVLASKDGVTGFYKLANGETLPAGKAYLVVDGLAPQFIGFSFGEATGIAAVEANGAGILNDGLYNLQGQRVAQPRKGMYIVNGKKVIIK